MNWRIIAAVLYVIGAMNMLSIAYMNRLPVTGRVVATAVAWPALPVFAAFTLLTSGRRAPK